MYGRIHHAYLRVTKYESDVVLVPAPPRRPPAAAIPYHGRDSLSHLRDAR